MESGHGPRVVVHGKHGWCVDNLWDFRKKIRTYILLLLFIQQNCCHARPSQRQKCPEKTKTERGRARGRARGRPKDRGRSHFGPMLNIVKGDNNISSSNSSSHTEKLSKNLQTSLSPNKVIDIADALHKVLGTCHSTWPF